MTKTTQGNGRFSTTTWMCCGQLSSTDEDGITTSFGYDSAHRLVEEIRSAVMDGDVTVTPETITSYTRDALGRAIQTRRDVGAMTSLESVAYDTLGRQMHRVDMLGRITSWTYSADGLTTTETLPSGATRVTVHGTDGNVIFTGGTAQRALAYSEEIAGNCLRRKTLVAGSQTVLHQQDFNGFGQEVCSAVPSTSGMVYTHNEYNALGQLTKAYQDTGTDSIPSASTHYEYDGFGNMVKQTLALAEEPTPLNSPVHEFAFGVEVLADGVYLVQSQTRYNIEGQALISMQKQLASALSATLEAKQISINERGLVTTQWTEYLGGAKRKQLLQVPTSNIVAESVMVDGQMIAQMDNQGINQTMSRAYTAHGMVLTQTEGRGNTQTVTTDIAGRTISATDAAGNVTTTTYCTCCDSPATVTDAQGNMAM